MRLKKVLIGAAAATALMVASVGVGYAVWSASGSGAGAGRALTAQNLVVTAVTPGAAAASLYPGGPAGWVYFTIQNPNPYAVTVTGLHWGTPTSTDTVNCPNANISVDVNAPTAVSLGVAANSTSGTFQVFGVLDLAKTAPDGCQGVVFDAPVTVTGAQQ